MRMPPFAFKVIRGKDIIFFLKSAAFCLPPEAIASWKNRAANNTARFKLLNAYTAESGCKTGGSFPLSASAIIDKK